MASKKFGKESKEFAFFGDFWQMVQKYWIPERDNDDYWKSAVSAADALYSKYKDNDDLERFSRLVTCAYLRYLEEGSEQ